MDQRLDISDDLTLTYHPEYMNDLKADDAESNTDYWDHLSISCLEDEKSVNFYVSKSEPKYSIKKTKNNTSKPLKSKKKINKSCNNKNKSDSEFEEGTTTTTSASVSKLPAQKLQIKKAKSHSKDTLKIKNKTGRSSEQNEILYSCKLCPSLNRKRMDLKEEDFFIHLAEKHEEKDITTFIEAVCVPGQCPYIKECLYKHAVCHGFGVGGTYFCLRCTFTTRIRKDFMIHKKTGHAKARSKSNLRKDNEDENTFQCCLCSYAAKSMGAIVQHLISKHATNHDILRNVLLCPLCKTSKNKKSFGRHLRHHLMFNKNGNKAKFTLVKKYNRDTWIKLT